jgi:hypothetical protein
VGDLAGAQAAERPQRECDLAFGGQRRMTAGEDETRVARREMSSRPSCPPLPWAPQAGGSSGDSKEGSDQIALAHQSSDRRLVLIFAHASVVGVLIGVAFLGLSVLLLVEAGCSQNRASLVVRFPRSTASSGTIRRYADEAPRAARDPNARVRSGLLASINRETDDSSYETTIFPGARIAA